MAKTRRVPLNRLVKPETFQAVKILAEVMDRSEGEVIDQAVEFFEAHNGSESRVVASYPPPSVAPLAATANARSILAEIETKHNIAPARVRETGSERAARERRERQERAAGLDSVQDDSIDRSDEYVSG